MKKKIIILGIIILVGGFIAYKIFSPKENANSLITTTVKTAPLVWGVDATGEVFAQNLVDVGTRATGQIKELYVKVGDHVKVGDKIIRVVKK